MNTLYKVLNYFGMLLDINGLGYTSEISDIWLGAEQTKRVFLRSSMQTAKRVLFLFGDYALSNNVTFFEKTRPHGISGLKRLPEWFRSQ